MTKNIVKAHVTPKRSTRVVETDKFDAFARRILRAYGRRVAAGDVEALRSLAELAAELDAVTRLAVTGLKHGPHGYSWAEIADRLGVSRQAAQMRYGDRGDRCALDRRLVEAGLCVTVATLAECFADHHPGIPAALVCPACGYRYPDGVSDCPTNAMVRPLLYRRRAEDTRVLDLLTPDQIDDLHDRRTARTNRTAARQASRPTPSPHRADSLLDLITREDSTP